MRDRPSKNRVKPDTLRCEVGIGLVKDAGSPANLLPVFRCASAGETVCRGCSRACSPGADVAIRAAGFPRSGCPGVAPRIPADRRHSRPECREALFSSAKTNRGERIRTFDLLVPNQF